MTTDLSSNGCLVCVERLLRLPKLQRQPASHSMAYVRQATSVEASDHQSSEGSGDEPANVSCIRTAKMPNTLALC